MWGRWRFNGAKVKEIEAKNISCYDVIWFYTEKKSEKRISVEEVRYNMELNRVSVQDEMGKVHYFPAYEQVFKQVH